jgi:predicted dehydrogenase
VSPTEKRRTRLGIVGCGRVSGVYLQCPQRYSNLEVVSCACRDLGRAEARAKEFNIPCACSVRELLEMPNIDIIVNITPPTAHADIAIAALQAGKHVYNEKPLTITTAEAKRVLSLARQKELRVGVAPDTFLGGGIQTCRKLIDEGAIGQPVAATAFFTSPGPEYRHPDPEFFFQQGGGPLFDMGPYYLTALITLLGPIRRVCGRITFPTRCIHSEPRKGALINVVVPTHISATIDFVAGPVATLVTSFDVRAAELPRIEIYGTKGTLSVPNPNTFGGPVRIWTVETLEWREVPLAFRNTENCRGLGISDLAEAITYQRPHRANGELGLHVLDVMECILESSRSEQHVKIASTCSKPDPLIAAI